MRTISSRQNPLVRQCREAARADTTAPLALLDGAHLIVAALDAGLTVPIAAVNTGRQHEPELASLIARLHTCGSETVAVTDSVMHAISPVRTPTGIVALATRELTSPESLLPHPFALLIAAVDVQDPGNLGALMRGAEAAAATGLIACGTSAHPLAWKSLRGSMGSALRLPLAVCQCPTDLLRAARAAGLRPIAAVPRGGMAPEAADWLAPVIVFVGGEGPGLPQELIDGCQTQVTIPMAEPVESLNVSVAGALVLYAARRQRMAGS
jgi:TrmH family RNA methyltransferase